MPNDPNRCRCGSECRCRRPWGTRRQYVWKWFVSPAALMPQRPAVWITPTQFSPGWRMDLPMQAGAADTFATTADKPRGPTYSTQQLNEIKAALDVRRESMGWD